MRPQLSIKLFLSLNSKRIKNKQPQIKVTMAVRCQQDLLFSSQTCRVFESDLPIYWVSPSYLSRTFSVLTQPFLFLSPTFRILTQSFSFIESAHPIFESDLPYFDSVLIFLSWTFSVLTRSFQLSSLRPSRFCRSALIWWPCALLTKLMMEVCAESVYCTTWNGKLK